MLRLLSLHVGTHLGKLRLITPAPNRFEKEPSISRYDVDKVVRAEVPAQLEESGAEVTTRQLADNEVYPALVRRLIDVTNEFGVDPDNDVVRKLAEIAATLAEVQRAAGISDVEITTAQERLAAGEGEIGPLTFITTVKVPDDSELVEHPILLDAPRHDRYWT